MQTASPSDITKLADLIKDIRIAMLTTAEPDGTLRSRPMATQQTPFDGTLWFFTQLDSPKIAELRTDRHVNISYADTSHQRYVSISGIATITQDRAKSKELWNPLYKAWFPQGLDDSNLALLKVHVNEAEYWQSPSGTVVKLAGFAKALLTGKQYNPGENKRLEIDPIPSA